MNALEYCQRQALPEEFLSFDLALIDMMLGGDYANPDRFSTALADLTKAISKVKIPAKQLKAVEAAFKLPRKRDRERALKNVD
jgi:hypothetical protein